MHFWFTSCSKISSDHDVEHEREHEIDHHVQVGDDEGEEDEHAGVATRAYLQQQKIHR